MILHRLQKEIENYRKTLAQMPPVALSLFVVTVVTMNLLANKELFHNEWIALDCGIVLSWLPFLIMDCVCKVYGGKAATRVSIFAIAINLLMFGIFKLVSLAPGMWGEYYETNMVEVNTALNNTIGGSTWIVFGSALAMALGSIVNSATNMTMGRMMRKDNYSAFAVRSFTSTTFGQITDNLTFALVVSLPLFGWTIKQVVFCSLTSALIELMLEVLFSRFGYKITKHWKK